MSFIKTWICWLACRVRKFSLSVILFKLAAFATCYRSTTAVPLHSWSFYSVPFFIFSSIHTTFCMTISWNKQHVIPNEFLSGVPNHQHEDHTIRLTMRMTLILWSISNNFNPLATNNIAGWNKITSISSGRVGRSETGHFSHHVDRE